MTPPPGRDQDPNDAERPAAWGDALFLPGHEPAGTARGPEEPATWWGPGWHPREALPLPALIARGLLDPEPAAALWLLIERGASVIVCAGPGRAGKTTLLSALRPFIAPERRRYYARGVYDAFAFAKGADPARSALLINEISPHLPIYLWGPAVRRAFALRRAGWQLFATAHAQDAPGLVRTLGSYPANATDEDLRGWDLALFIEVLETATGPQRRVRQIVSFSTPSDRGLVLATVADRITPDAPLRLHDEALAALAPRWGIAPEELQPALIRRVAALAAAEIPPDDGVDAARARYTAALAGEPPESPEEPAVPDA